MKRGPKPVSQNGNGAGQEELVKSTYNVRRTLKSHLQVLAFEEGKAQSDVVEEAITEYLRNREIDPTRPPRIVKDRTS